MQVVKLKDLKKILKPRKPDSHKGENGRVLVIGGSKEFVGAPTLAGLAISALRSGVDTVNVAAPEKVAYAINSYSPDLITTKLKGDYITKKHLNELLKLSKKFDSILLGNGLGLKKETQTFVKEFVKKCKKPLVLDADAIKAVKGMKFNGNVLLTPHKKEFEILSGKTPSKDLKKNTKIIKNFAKNNNCVVLLKGKVDIISDGKKVKLNKTGNVRMTVAGTGDVLAGMCSAFIALNKDLFASACAAAYINGLTGDKLLKKKGRTFIASDMFEEIKKIIN